MNLNDIQDQPISAMNGLDYLSNIDLGEDSLPQAYMEADDGRGYHAVANVDYLAFADERGDIPDGWLVDEALTSEALAALEKRWKQIMLEEGGIAKEYVDTVSVDNASGDEAGFETSIMIPSDADLTVKKAFDTIINPFFATIQNATDPGTFNHPYLWSDLDGS